MKLVRERRRRRRRCCRRRWDVQDMLGDAVVVVGERCRLKLLVHIVLAHYRDSTTVKLDGETFTGANNATQSN